MRRPLGESRIKAPQSQPEWANSACILCRSMFSTIRLSSSPNDFHPIDAQHRGAIHPGELDHGQDGHKLDAGLRRLCWPLCQPRNIFEAQLQHRRKLRVKNLKRLGRIKLLTVDELSPRGRRIRAQHDVGEIHDELGKLAQGLVMGHSGFGQSPPGALARRPETLRDIRTDILGRCVVKS